MGTICIQFYYNLLLIYFFCTQQEYLTKNVNLFLLFCCSEFKIAFYDKTTNTKLSGDILCSVEGCARTMVNGTYKNIVLTMMRYSDAVTALISK